MNWKSVRSNEPLDPATAWVVYLSLKDYLIQNRFIGNKNPLENPLFTSYRSGFLG